MRRPSRCFDNVWKGWTMDWIGGGWEGAISEIGVVRFDFGIVIL